MARPDRFARVLLDASALIAVIKGEPEFACLRSLLAAIDRADVVLVESTAILIEVLPAHPADTEAQAKGREKVRALLDSTDTELVDVSTVVANKAAGLATALGLKTMDAVHLATAIVSNVEVLIVRDKKFPEGDYEGVYVTGPFDIDDDKLFSTLDQDA